MKYQIIGIGVYFLMPFPRELNVILYFGASGLPDLVYKACLSNNCMYLYRSIWKKARLSSDMHVRGTIKQKYHKKKLKRHRTVVGTLSSSGNEEGDICAVNGSGRTISITITQSSFM